MKITFPYAKYDINKLPSEQKEVIQNIFPERQYIIQPRIRFLLKNPVSKKSIGMEGIIDSGADYCFFNHEIAEFLNIPIGEGKPLSVCGIGGIRTTYFHPVQFEFRFGSKRNSIKYDVNAGFFPKEESQYHEPCLLGEYGFFEYFRITFDLAKYNLELEPVFHQ